ncbi:MAG: VanW family protein [Firmicutes bacterium]|nr:VanW family protein [Bacillota bacterium]
MSNLQIALAKRKVKLLFFFAVIVLFSSVSLITINAAFIFTDNIYTGVIIGNIPVGGLSVDEARNKIIATFQDQISKSTINVSYENETWSIAPKDIELNINADDLVMQAHNVGRTGNIINILKERYLAVNGGYTVPLTQNYNHDKLYALLTNISKYIDRNPQNASLVYNNKTIHVTPEIWGQQVDLPTSLTDITNKLSSGIPVNSKLIVHQKPPSIVSQDFADIDNLIAEYTTQFNPNDEKRYQNIAIAAKNINNTLVHPGEIFSFNQSVGPRLPEYGYKEAPVLVDGKLLLDWGGGVCQVSTTLYNTALLADMDIEERTSHFKPPSYVPLGQDAAVADNLLDFKFKNSSPCNIYITSEVFNNRITVSIFGKNFPNPAEIQIESTSKTLGYNTLIKQDNSLSLGKEIVESVGQKGFAVTTYRVKMMNGQEISRENLSSDEFKPEDRIIRIGTKSQSQQSTK